MGKFCCKNTLGYWAKSQNSARYAGAFWGKYHFFGKKVNKVPCIIFAIWGKINILGIFCIKTHWIIRQKSQNSARYAAAFWGKNHFFGRKVNKVSCIIAAIYFLRILGVKTHRIIGQKSQNSAQYAGEFWRKKHFFWEKSQ